LTPQNASGAAEADGHPVLVATPLEPALVERIRAVDPHLEVVFAPELLPPPRYPGDHGGEPDFARAPADQRRWEALVAAAEVLFGIPGDTPDGLADAVGRAPGLRWVQATAAGAGQQVRAAGLSADDVRRVAITTASGVHAGPLAEFVLLGLLAFAKDLPRLEADKAARRWTHRPVRELRGATLVVVGLGEIGRAVARLAAELGMRVIGVSRGGDARGHPVAAMHTPDRLHLALAGADALVVTLPLTDATRGMVDRAALASLAEGAIVINVGRGAVLDEDALVELLRSGHLAGAALDVFATEPLPPESPLWELGNVLITPHTAALSVHENERIVELFADNLRRYLAGEPLRNRVDPDDFY
jgi:phosphoglycerate dehydrogenase-like enzyme